jgi:hypothetical protein
MPTTRLPAAAAAVSTGGGSSGLTSVSRLVYPISEACLAVGLWLVMGITYLPYLMRSQSGQIRERDRAG